MNDFCTLCNSNTSTPFNFLLPCVKCRSFFHHRCHNPPLSDKELIDIIKLYNLHKQRGDKNPSFIWICGACAAQPNQPPPVPPSRSATSAAHHRPPPPPSRQEPIIVLDSDDDSDVVIESQPTKILAVKSRKTVSSAKSVTKSANVPPPPQSASKRAQDPKAPSTTSSAVPHPHTIETRHDTGIRIIEDPFVELLPPPGPTTSPLPRPPLRIHSSATSSTSAHLSAGLGSLHMSTNEDAHMSTEPPSHQPPRKPDQEENEWDLEYVTPPAPPPAQLPSVDGSMPPPPPPAHDISSRSQGHARTAQSLPPIAAWVSNDDEEEEEEEPDEEDEDEIEVDEIDATPAPMHTVNINRPVLLPAWINQRFNLPPSNESRKPFSRKKFRAQNITPLPNNNSISASRHFRPAHLAPFSFNAEQWMRDKRRNLPQYSTTVV